RLQLAVTRTARPRCESSKTSRSFRPPPVVSVSIFRSVSFIEFLSARLGPRRVRGPAADLTGWLFVSLSGVWSQKVSQKAWTEQDKIGVRFGPCRTVSFSVGRQNLTTNLGVRSSNLFGRARLTYEPLFQPS